MKIAWKKVSMLKYIFLKCTQKQVLTKNAILHQNLKGYKSSRGCNLKLAQKFLREGIYNNKRKKSDWRKTQFHLLELLFLLETKHFLDSIHFS